MPRGGIREKNKQHRSRSERAVSLCATGCLLPSLLFAPFFRVVFDSRSSFFAPKPYGNACCAGCGGRRKQCRSVPRGGVRRLWAPGGVKKKEIGLGPIERCHSVPRCGVKKKGSIEDRESSVALGHRVALKKKKLNDRSRPERAVSLCATGWR